MMPTFQLSSLIDALEEHGFRSRAGSMELDVHPMKRPYFERWLSNRDGFLKLLTGSVDFLGIEEVVRMGPFFNIYCMVENQSIIDADDNAHDLLDASPYFQLHNGKVASMGWSGGVIADTLAKDTLLFEEFTRNLMKEEVKGIRVKASNYCCVVETRAWEPSGLASAFSIIDRVAL